MEADYFEIQERRGGVTLDSRRLLISDMIPKSVPWKKRIDLVRKYERESWNDKTKQAIKEEINPKV